MKNYDKESCVLFGTQIYDNLEPHYIFGDSGNQVRFSGGSSSAISGFSAINSLLNSSVESDVWVPAKITPATFSTQSAPYLNGKINSKSILGINNFLNIANAKFKDITSTDSIQIGVDWILNDPVNDTITPIEGILFWYKKHDHLSDRRLIENWKVGDFIYSESSLIDKGKTIPAKQIMVKLNNDEIQVLPRVVGGTTSDHISPYMNIKDDPLGTGTNIYEPYKIKLHELYKQNTTFNKLWKLYDSIYYLKNGASFFSIHIPDGDYFSYKNDLQVLANNDDQIAIDALARQEVNPPREFLSYNLLSTYRKIYNQLLNILPLSLFTSGDDKTKYKKYLNLRALSYILATGPQFDDTTININGYINTSTTNIPTYVSYIPLIETFINRTNVDGLHIDAAIEICKKIYKENKNLQKNKEYNTSNSSFRINISDNSENISKAYNDIYLKLVSKYGCYIKIPTSSSDIYFHINKELKWLNNKDDVVYTGGPNASVDLDFEYWTNKNRDLVSEASRTAFPNNVGNDYYDQSIRVGPMRIRTDISNQKVYFETLDPGSAEASTIANIIKPLDNIYFNQSSINNYIMIPEIRYSMFYKQGGFKIASSECYIDEKIGSFSMSNGKLDMKPIFLKIGKLGSYWNIPDSDTKHYNYFASDNLYNKTVTLGFKIPASSNSCIKLYKINISFLRYNSSELCNCESFYRENITRSRNDIPTISWPGGMFGELFDDLPKSVGYRRFGYCDSITLGKASEIIGGVVVEGQNESIVPGVSTKFAPPIKSYGGYDKTVVAAIGIQLPDHPNPGDNVPVVESHNPKYTNDTKCYMRSGLIKDPQYYTDSSDNTSRDNLMASTRFIKGFFHPHLGWIDYDNPLYSSYGAAGKTAVVDHKPNFKNRFSFKGMGFLFDDRTNETYNGDGLKNLPTKLYKSSIEILSSENNIKSTEEELNAEIGRRDINFFLNGYSYEYVVNECIPFKAKRDANGNLINKEDETDCNNNNYPKITYNIYPLKDNTGSDIVSFSDINNLYIKDIDLKLNFINFDNIRDMKITIKMETSNSQPGTGRDQYYHLITPGIIPNNATINSYLTSLRNQNAGNQIVLMNKDNIKNYIKDFSLIFSDYANPHANFDSKKVNDPPGYTTGNEQEKSFSRVLNFDIDHNGTIHPTMQTDDYSHNDVQKFKEILNNYNVCIIDNKFRKWHGTKLINTKFTLEIEIFNNYDSNNVGSIKDLHLKNINAINALNNRQKSIVADNSVCSWELIIDTFKTSDPQIKKDVRLNINNPVSKYIDYSHGDTYIAGTTISSVYPDGYNFLGDFTDTKFLIPPVNMNAPHSYLTGINECKFPNSSLNKFRNNRIEPVNMTAFTQAFNLFALGIGLGVTFAAAGGIGGALVGLGVAEIASNIATAGIVTWFANQRKNAVTDAYDDSFYDPNYDLYGFGIPEKALIEISVDNGQTWYTFDANIFKYNKLGSPVYKPLMLNYMGAGNASNYTSLIELNKQEDRGSTTVENSLIITGKKIDPKKLLFNSEYDFSATTPDIVARKGSLILGSDTILLKTMNEEQLKELNVFEFEGVKPFFYIKDEAFTPTGEQFDIIYNDIQNGKIKIPKNIPNLLLTISNNQYNTYIIYNTDIRLKKIKTNQSVILQHLQASDNFFGVKLYNFITNSELYNLAMMRSMYTYTHTPDFVHSAFGEGSWGTGTSATVIQPVNKILLPKDLDLLDYSIIYSNNRYAGRVNLLGQSEKIPSASDKFKISLFDDKAWPLINSINDIPYAYKNSNSHITSNFYFYTTKNGGSFFKNKSIYQAGAMILTDLLVPYQIVDNYQYEQNLKDNTTVAQETQGEENQDENNTNTVRNLSAVDKVRDYDNNLYWISLDKSQLGSYSAQTSIKILQKIEYYCVEPSIGPETSAYNCYNVCGENDSYLNRDIDPSINNETNIELMRILTGNKSKINNSLAPITFVNKQHDKHKTIINTETNNSIEWITLPVEKKNLRLSCGNSNVDAVFYTREYYSIPKNTISIDDLNSAKSKVRADTLLDSKNDIMVRFKYIVRKLTNLDNYFEKYIINTRGDSVYVGPNRATDESPIKNYFYSWFCNALDIGTSTLNSAVPPLYKMMNEIIYRAFFGSADGIEFKSLYSKTQHPQEWIPYEYDNSLQCAEEEDVNVFVATVKRLDIIGLTLRCWLLKKLVVGSKNKNKIVNNCIRYIKALNPPGSTSANYGIVPDKKQFDIWYENQDRDATAKSSLANLVKTFLG